MKDLMNNITILKTLDAKTCTEILNSIASDYGITQGEAFDEVTDPEAESLWDYLREPVRSAAILVYKRAAARSN